ncbi:hypothetical protein FOA52_006800 [Chlamydomonas sp. UWO 241]|nr:hypothetical protein FOA52_006800 [Chlamydomonas sp. UWO 241]
MVASGEHQQGAGMAIQFTMGSPSSAGSLLQLGSGRRVAAAAASPLLMGGSSAVSFSTRGSAKQRSALVSRASRSRARASPFASISMGLAPFAAATVSSGKGAKAAAVPAAPASVPAKKKKTLAEVFDYASKRALSGGIPGMVAMGLQVLSLMWLRTTMNYQYKNGGTMIQAISTLYAQGGIPRFYSGLAPALIQGPLSRFGDTAANTGMLALLEETDLNPALKTILASAGAAIFRIFLMPVDAVKTTMQVQGSFSVLANKIKVSGPLVLYDGAVAASLATFVGHYPWFATYNSLNTLLPQYDGETELTKRLLRSAFLGWCSSLVSDVCSNSIRVIKTSKQSSADATTYMEVVKGIYAKDGLGGFFFRGLGTKLITNGIQGVMFSVLWRLGMDYMAKQDKEKAEAEAEAAKAAAKK